MPKNLICCHSPVIKWRSCLTHKRLSNAPAFRASKTRTAGGTLDDCIETTSPSRTFLGLTSPKRALLSTEKQRGPEQKQNQTLLRGSGKNPSLAERGRSRAAGSALPAGAGQELGAGFNCQTGLADLQPKHHPNFCLKLAKELRIKC